MWLMTIFSASDAIVHRAHYNDLKQVAHVLGVPGPGDVLIFVNHTRDEMLRKWGNWITLESA